MAQMTVSGAADQADRTNHIDCIDPAATAAASPATASTMRTPQGALAPPRGALAGQRLDHYQLVELLGVGGMAEVYCAHDVDLDREVAVKILAGHLTQDDSYVDEFRHEARRVARLRHPHVVPIYHVGEGDVDGRHVLYLVMPMLCTSLRDKLRVEGPLPYAEAVRLTLEAAEGLRAAHSAGLVHCDVKPGNILLDADDRAVLCDFGVALDMAGATHEEAVSSTKELVAGTPAYMAPEQLRGMEIDQRADVYSLGVVLYELLTGQRPFDGKTPLEIAARAFHDPVIPPSALVPDRALPVAIDDVLLTALARDPRQRFQSADELALALRRILVQADPLWTSQPSAAALPFRFPERGGRHDGSHPTPVPRTPGVSASAARQLLVVVAAAVLLISLGGALTMLRYMGGGFGTGGSSAANPFGVAAVGASGQTVATATSAPPTTSTSTANTAGAGPSQQAQTPGATDPTSTAATGVAGTPAPPNSTPIATATSAPSADPALSFSPTTLALAAKNGNTARCAATQTITNTSANAVGWSWQSPTISGLSFEINGSDAGAWPSATTTIPAGGHDTLVVSSDCKHQPHGSYTVVAQDSLGQQYDLLLTR